MPLGFPCRWKHEASLPEGDMIIGQTFKVGFRSTEDSSSPERDGRLQLQGISVRTDVGHSASVVPLGLHATVNSWYPTFKGWAYSYPRVIHRSEESPKDPLPAASVNNSAAGKVLVMNFKRISLNRENTHRPATNSWARHSTPNNSPSSQAMRWSLTNTQWRTASISRSHYKPFAWISQRVFLQPITT